MFHPLVILVPLKIAYVLMKYPTVSQVFIEREMRVLAAQGLEIEVHPCLDFRPAGSIREPVPPELAVVRPGSAAATVWTGLAGAARELWKRPGLLRLGLRLLIRNRPRHAEGWFHTLWGTLFALARADEFRRRKPAVIHGAWATAPATVAAVLSELTGVPFSFGAHAYDLHRHGGDPLLPAKMRGGRFVHTTTQTNVEHLQARFPARRADIVLARRGLPGLPEMRERPERGELRLLSVGRLVEKKGQAYQVAACRELARRGVAFRLRIIGEGPLRPALEAAIAEAALSEQIELLGEQSPAQVQAAYGWADAFWHTGIVDAQGDRDGLPNVVPEAFAHGLPVISSLAGGAGEAVCDDRTGLIVDPADTSALADAAERLAGDAGLRHRLGQAGRIWVEENFLSEINTRHLAQAFVHASRKDGH